LTASVIRFHIVLNRHCALRAGNSDAAETTPIRIALSIRVIAFRVRCASLAAKVVVLNATPLFDVPNGALAVSASPIGVANAFAIFALSLKVGAVRTIDAVTTTIRSLRIGGFRADHACSSILLAGHVAVIAHEVIEAQTFGLTDSARVAAFASGIATILASSAVSAANEPHINATRLSSIPS